MSLLLAVSGAWLLASPGVWQTEMVVPQQSALVPVQAIVVRLDPSQLRFALERSSKDYGMVPDWTIERMPPDALVAFNAGQFAGGAPWGWFVRDGVEVQPTGAGPLSMAFVVNKAGTVSLVGPDELSAARDAVQAFQSYPALLIGQGEIPAQLQVSGRGVDLTHRDSRLAIGLLRDGSVVVALTRVDLPGGDTLPWGPTVPEMAAFMKSLGCVRAMLLDGGLSGQLAIRNPQGLSSWKNWRPVPLGLLVFPRTQN